MIPHEAAGQRQLLPLAKADLDSTGPSRTELCLQAGGQPRYHIIGSRPIDSRNNRCVVIESGDVAQTYRVARAKLESEKVLERARDVRSPIVNGNPREVDSIDEDSSLV